MSFEREIDSLMGFETSISGAKGVVPAYLESHYNRLGAVENIRESGHASEFALAALIRTIVLDDDEEIREAALSAICEVSESDQAKRLALYLACADAHERVVTTALEQAVAIDISLAKMIAERVVNNPDILVSSYVSQLLKD